jgi:DNA-binding transcriptional LysR family regulator
MPPENLQAVEDALIQCFGALDEVFNSLQHIQGHQARGNVRVAVTSTNLWLIEAMKRLDADHDVGIPTDVVPSGVARRLHDLGAAMLALIQEMWGPEAGFEIIDVGAAEQ